MAGNLIQNQFTTARDWPFGSAVSLVLMAIVLRLLDRQHAQPERGPALRRLLPLYAAAAFAFLHLPLLVLAVFSFNSSRFTIWQGFSLRWYEAALHDTQLAEAAWNSLVIALAATLVSTCLGTLCAYGLWKRKSEFVSGSLYTTLVTPEIVMGVSLLAFFQWVFRFLHVQLGMHTVILAHVMFSLAYVVIVIMARLRTVDPHWKKPRSTSAGTSGTHFGWSRCRSLGPAIVSAALLAFTISFDDYVITSMVAGVDSETLPMVIYAMARRGANPVVNAISTMIVVGLGVLIVVSERLAQVMTRRTLFLMGIAGASGCMRDRRPRLNVFNWSSYVGPDTIPNFEREFDVRVRYAVYESNEEMLARVMSGNSGWDVVFPTNYLIEPMRSFGLLAPLDHSRLPNLQHLDAVFQKPVVGSRSALGCALHVERDGHLLLGQAGGRHRSLGGPLGFRVAGPDHDAG